MLNKKQHSLKYYLLLIGLGLIVVSALFFSVARQAKAGEEKVLDIQVWQTQNGVPVYFVASKELPMVDIAVLFDAGSRRDGDQHGLAFMTANVLSKGSLKSSADQIARAFDEVGAIYSADVDRDMAVHSLRSLSDDKYLNSAITAFVEVISAPNFPEKSVARMQQRVLVDLQSEEQDPGSVAERSYYKLLYPKDPYGHAINGTADSITKLSVDGLKNFYQQYYVKENAKIIIVGDLSVKRAKQVANAISTEFTSGAVAEKLAQAQTLEQALSLHTDFPAEQTHILIGQVAIDRTNPDYLTLQLGNHILGGGAMTSRLFDEVREKRGLVYNVASYFQPLKNRGPFTIVLQTRNAETQNAIDVVQQVINDFIENGPSDEELHLAKKNIIGSFPLLFASNSGILANVANIAYYDLPLDYLDTYREKMAAIQKEDIINAFRKNVKPKTLATITVGQSAKNG